MNTALGELFAETIDGTVPVMRPFWRRVGWWEEVCNWTLSVLSRTVWCQERVTSRRCKTQWARSCYYACLIWHRWIHPGDAWTDTRDLGVFMLRVPCQCHLKPRRLRRLRRSSRTSYRKCKYQVQCDDCDGAIWGSWRILER